MISDAGGSAYWHIGREYLQGGASQGRKHAPQVALAARRLFGADRHADVSAAPTESRTPGECVSRERIGDYPSSSYSTSVWLAATEATPPLPPDMLREGPPLLPLTTGGALGGTGSPLAPCFELFGA
jgi:hypothetical protein